MKEITLASVALFLSFMVSAQTSSPKPVAAAVQFGIKAGVNIADLKNEKGNFIPATNDSYIGYHAGLLSHIHINDYWAVQPEVVFSSQGAKTANDKYIVNYINVPVLAQLMYHGLRLETGPQLGFLVEAHTEDNAGNENEALKTFLKSTDFSWIFGAGYLTTVGLGIDARYNLGITNIRNDPAQNIKNRVWQIGLFYQFNR